MKKTIILAFILSVTVQFSSCKSEKKEEKKETPVVVEKSAPFSLKTAENTINFTAYKTTEKVPVKGQFKKVNILSGGEGNSIKEAIDGAEFSIPVSSIFTKDTSRDFKIQKFFFAIMENTSLLSGKLVLENDTNGYANIIMNGITQKLPFTYTITNKTFQLNGTMNLGEWKGEAAVASLNTACKDLHKGADGVSKTWNEIAINISSTFK